MKALMPLAWILGLTFGIVFFGWIAMRMVRWARRGSKGTSLLGLGMAIPSAGITPQPPPQVQIEQVKRDIQGRKNSDSADPDK
jgi:hypothetical protein